MGDWSTFFKTRLAGSGQFIFDHEARHGETNILTFKNSARDNLTTIQIGLLDNGDLITFEIHNPLTPGFSEQQRREYFYKYSFHPTESYGDPGLEFIQLNIDHFDKLLREGLAGKEIQYYKDGQLARSDVFQNRDDVFFTTIQFEKKKLLKRLLSTFSSKEEFDFKKEIELREIFHGINSLKQRTLTLEQ